MSGTKTSRFNTKRELNSHATRNATKNLLLEKNKHNSKDKRSSKFLDYQTKSETLKAIKSVQNTKVAIKKSNIANLPKHKKSIASNRKGKFLIVSERSSSVSVVQSCNQRGSVSVRKYSYSTKVVRSSNEDSSSEDESEEEEEKEDRPYTRRQRTVRHKTSTVKSNVSVSKRDRSKTARKAKAIKRLCDKLSGSPKSKVNSSRKLRDRFPYTPTQKLPKARAQRMASLNALAKVHCLYDNEGPTVLNDDNLIDYFLNNIKQKKESKPAINSARKIEKVKDAECDKIRTVKKEKCPPPKPKVQRRGKKRKLPDVEVFDTKLNKRMARLNAQAILEASFLDEPKPKRIYRKSGNVKKLKCETDYDISIVKEEIIDVDDIQVQPSPQVEKPTKKPKSPEKDISQKIIEPSRASKKIAQPTDVRKVQKFKAVESAVSVIERDPILASEKSCSIGNSSIVTSTASTEVGVTQYTEFTEVHINTQNNSEVKEESKAERKIESIIQNDDVAITQLYRYKSKSAQECSYYVQMQTTYKPACRNHSPSTSSSNDSVRPFSNEPVPASSQSYYSHNPILPPQPYHSSISGIHPIGMDRGIPHQYGSAFSVPYRHQSPMQFPLNEYGYYQPAGPLINQGPDQSVIVKPVPCHPQPNPHQTPQRPQQPPNRPEGFPAFEPRPHNRIAPVHSNTLPSAQKPSPPKTPLRSEAHAPEQATPQFPKKQPQGESRSRGLSGSGSSFTTPPKHVRSPVMPTPYSSQQTPRSYQAQKRVTNTHRNYSHPYERKEPEDERGRYSSSFVPHPGTSSSKRSPPRDGFRLREANERHPQLNFAPVTGSQYGGIQTERSIGFKPPQRTASNLYSSAMTSSMHQESSGSNFSPHAPSTSTSSSIYNPEAYSNLSRLETPSGMHVPVSSANANQSAQQSFVPFHSSGRGGHFSGHRGMSRYSPRPPTVIDITGDAPRDTKTYIQLEVPRNSHREKIVVVDVEEDDLEKKHLQPKESDKTSMEYPQSRQLSQPQQHVSDVKPSTPTEMPPVHAAGVTQDAVESENDAIFPLEQTIKVEKVSENNTAVSEESEPHQDKRENDDSRSPDLMIIEVKKKKESAVVRRARLQGKQRTYRDCYDRPLAPLDTSKKTDEVATSTKEENSATEIQKTDEVNKTRKVNDAPAIKVKKADGATKIKKAEDASTCKLKKAEETSTCKLKKAEETSTCKLKKAEEISTCKLKKAEEASTNKVKKAEETSTAKMKKIDASATKAKKVEDAPATKVKKVECASTSNLKKLEEASTPKMKKVDDASSAKLKKVDKTCTNKAKKVDDASTAKVKKVADASTAKVKKVEEAYAPVVVKTEISVDIEKHLSKNLQPKVSLSRLVLPKLEKPPQHGWTWEGPSCDKEVFLCNDDPPCVRRCYPSIKHEQGDIINVRDCVFLRSGPRKTDLPFVAKVTALWENSSNGEMMMSLLWYYRPEHTEMSKKIHHMEDEIFASKHKDTNSVACIEDKCYVLTYSEYCRYRCRCKMQEDNSSAGVSIVPLGIDYPRRDHLPVPTVSPDMVLFCRKVYDYRQKRLLKNPL